MRVALVRSSRTLLAATAVAAVLAAGAGAAAHQARPVHRGPYTGAVPGRSAGSSARGRELAADSNWGGYVAGGTSYKTVTATWVNPKVDCSVKGIGSWWVGFDGYGTSTVEQIGVDADCTSGTLSYNPWWEMYPGDSHYFNKAAAGDTMTATVVHNSGSSYTLKLSDSTQGWNKSFDASLDGAQNQGAEVIVEPVGSGGGSVPDLPNFGTLTFTGATVDGKDLGSVSTSPLTLSRGGTTLAETGKLSGSSFPMTWKHS